MNQQQIESWKRGEAICVTREHAMAAARGLTAADRAGRIARLRGEPLVRNPYPSDAQIAVRFAWEDGWKYAERVLTEGIHHCRFCGCTEEHACVLSPGIACCWVAPGVCSHPDCQEVWRKETGHP